MVGGMPGPGGSTVTGMARLVCALVVAAARCALHGAVVVVRVCFGRDRSGSGVAGRRIGRVVAIVLSMALLFLGLPLTGASAAGAASLPVNTALPMISGGVAVASVLSASKGTWSNNPASYKYSWQRCDATGANCVFIAKATFSTYTVALGDVGSTLRVDVTAKNSGGSASSTSAATIVVPPPPAPLNSVLPKVTGTVAIGSILRVSDGTWTYSSGNYTYSWERCDAAGSSCVVITGKNSNTYRATVADAGATLRAAVTTSNVTGSTTATSQQSSVVPPPPAPVNLALPSVTGKSVVGDTLRASNGRWSSSPTTYAYQWERCDLTGGACTAIGGATLSTYVEALTDAASTLRVMVSASNIGGTTTATSAQSAVVLVPPVPVDTVLPAITGTIAVGYTLSASKGRWSNSPTGFTYTWELCDATGTVCAAISGAIVSTYMPISADAGSTLRVTVTAENLGGMASATSAQSAVVVVPLPPGNTVLPRITGTTKVSDPLSASSGRWSNTPTTYGYQWERCNSSGASCSVIGGAAASTYVLSNADGGSTLRVVVAAGNPAGSTTAMSVQSAVVTGGLPPPPPPVNLSLPLANGAAVVGDTLTADTGTWSNSPASYTYAWERCDSNGANCVAISGANASSYVLTATDSGSTFEVLVSATNLGGTGSATSVPSLVVVGVPQNALVPVISGVAVVGSTLSASTGTWTQSPSGYIYTWLACDASGANCVAISGATINTYVVTAANDGSTLKVAVTAVNVAGSATSTSTVTLMIVNVPLNTTTPAITGTLVSGSTVSASTGTWTEYPTSYAYQWAQCDALGANCVQITGATDSTYLLSDNQVGSTLAVVVTASNAAGMTSAASPPTTSVWPKAPSNTSLPTITGTVALNSLLTATNGAWTESPVGYTYEWQQCDSSGAICTAITGATAGTYTPIPANVGSTLVVMVTASNIGGSTSATSTPSIVVPASLDAVFTATPTTGVAPLAVSFDASASIAATADSIASYAWNFGDGSSGTGVTTSHTYPVGTYQATLTITSTAKLTATATTSISTTLPAPSGAFTLEAASGTAPLLQVFTATETPGTVARGAADPYTYSWNFGDGSALGTGKILGHRFGIGMFTATLTATDPSGTSATSSQTFTVSPSAPVALATATPATGSAPLSVAFDASQSLDRNPGGSITSYSWDYGDGSVGTGESTSHAYMQDATFAVVLTVTSSEGLTATQDIAIDASRATALFTTSYISGFSPLAVAFDASGSKAATGETIASYVWNFGDGATGTGVTPTHTYGPGSFNATLTVTTSAGKIATQSTTITVAAQTPISSFQASAVSGTSPLVVIFDGTNSIDPNLTGAMSYAWNFGDGSTGTGMTPTHTYGPGTFNATLTVTSDGLSNVQSTTITAVAAAPHASVTTTGTDGVAPFPVTFNATASFDPNPGGQALVYSWNFGDGTTGTGVTPTHTYMAGTYTATLTVTNSAGLTASESTAIFVDPHPLIASFITNENPSVDASTTTFNVSFPTIGVGPLTVVFNAAGSSDPNNDGGIVSYNWNFGDGTTGTGEMLSHTYGPGLFVASLTVTSAAGVSSQLLPADMAGSPITTPMGILALMVEGALVNGTTPQVGGTAGLAAISVAASATTANASFGASGGAGSSPGDSPASNGIQCDPVITTLCWYPQINLNAMASSPAGVGSTIVSYQWDYGDGQTQSGGSTEADFYNAPGTYTVTLTVTDSNGKTATTSQQVTVQLASAPSFTVSTNSGPGPLKVSFDGSSSLPGTSSDPIATYNWDFGDGTTGTGETLTHTYSTPGDYLPSLSVVTAAGNSNQTDPESGPGPVAVPNYEQQSIYVDQPPNAVISQSPVLGMLDVISFDGSTSKDPAGSIAGYSWNFGDGTTGTGVAIDHVYSTPGTYVANLAITSSDGLTSQASTHVVIANGPTAAVSTSTPDLTFSGGNPFGQFNASASTAGVDGPITSYQWNFGDGTTATSALATTYHLYKASGIFTVSVTVTDSSGNTAIAYTNVNVEPAVVTVAGTGNSLCYGITTPCTDTMMGNSGPANKANFTQIAAVAVANGNTYVGDNYTRTVSEIAPDGIITRIAGCADVCDYFAGSPQSLPSNALALDAAIGNITSIAVDGAGNLYILDGGYELVYKVTPNGVVSVIAGSTPINYWDTFSGDGGPATQAVFYEASSIAVDKAGNVYIADAGNSRIREISAVTGIVTTVAGDGSSGYGGDGGLAVNSALSGPTSVALDAAGNLYISDANNNRIREVSAATGIITTIAGAALGINYSNTYGNGDLATSGAEFPGFGLAVDTRGNVYFNDSTSIYRIDQQGIQSSVQIPASTASSGASGIAGLAVDASGNVVFGNSGSDTIERLQYPTCGSGIGYSDCSLNNLDVTNAALPGIDLDGANLTNSNFSDSNLAGASFVGATLTGDSFVGADLGEANFSGVNLNGLDFTGANLTDATLTGATLTNAILTGANLTDVNLTGLNMSGAHLDGGVTFAGVTLARANLSGANLTGASLTGISSWASVNLSGSDLNSANFAGDDLSGVSSLSNEMPGANLTDVNLTGVNLTGANLAGATLLGTTLSGTTMTGANLSGANLTGQDLSGLTLPNLNLIGANLTGVLLTGASLTGANMTGANLTGVLLTGANLTMATLSGQNLSIFDLTGINFTSAILANTTLTGATMNSTTLLAGANLTGDDLSNRDLQGFDLTGDTLVGVDFAGATLTGLSLAGDNMAGANLSNQDLSGWNLEHVNLDGANLDGANLSNADLTDAVVESGETVNTNFAGITITGATVPGINLSNITFSNANFTNTDLYEANLSNDTLSNVTLDGANLSGVNFTSSNLDGSTLYGTPGSLTPLVGPGSILCTDEATTAAFWSYVIFFGQSPGVQQTPNCQTNLMASLAGANMTGATWEGADLQYVDLTGAILTDANLQNANLGRAKLKDATLTGTNLNSAWAEAADFTNATMQGANLASSTLDQANFNGADLTGGSLNRAELYLATLKGTTLLNTDISQADLSFADMTNAYVAYYLTGLFDPSYNSYLYANYYYTTCWNGASDNANGEGNDSTYVVPVPLVPIAGIPVQIGCPSGVTNLEAWATQTTITILYDVLTFGLEAAVAALVKFSSSELIQMMFSFMKNFGYAADGFDVGSIGFTYPGS